MMYQLGFQDVEEAFWYRVIPTFAFYGSCSAGCHTGLIALGGFPTHIDYLGHYATTSLSRDFVSKWPSVAHRSPT